MILVLGSITGIRARFGIVQVGNLGNAVVIRRGKIYQKSPAITYSSFFYTALMPNIHQVLTVLSAAAPLWSLFHYVRLFITVNCTRELMNYFLPAVWLHTPYGLLRQTSHAHPSLQRSIPQARTHVQSHAPNTPRSWTGNLLHPLTK